MNRFHFPRGRAADVLVAAALACAAAVWAFDRSTRLPAAVYRYEVGATEITDVWFDADLPKMGCLMFDRRARQHRVTAEHPLISAAAFVPAQAAFAVTRHHASAVAWLTAGAAASWTAVFFGSVRAFGLASGVAALFTALALVSAAGVFWLAVPESYVIGSMTMLLPLALVGARTGRFGDIGLTSAVAGSFAMTLTNGVSGVGAALAARPWRQALQVVVNAIVVLWVCWWMQSWWFPHSESFFGGDRLLEIARDSEAPQVGEALRAMLFHGIVMPEIGLRTDEQWRGLSVQASAMGSGGWPGAVAGALWLTLSGIGIAGLLRRGTRSRATRLLGGVIAAQVALHLAIGRETFLYAMHTAPLLVLLAASGARGRVRPLVVATACALIVLLLVHNTRQFDRAVALVDGIVPPIAAGDVAFALEAECR